LARLSRRFQLCKINHWPGPRSLATTSGVSVDVLSSGYLDVSVPRVRLLNLCIQFRITLRWGFPIRKFTDQCLLAAPHDLSQRATSFIASQCQGIHQMPLRRLIHSSRSRAGANPHDKHDKQHLSALQLSLNPPRGRQRQTQTFSAKRPASLQSGTHSVTLHKTIFTMSKNRGHCRYSRPRRQPICMLPMDIITAKQPAQTPNDAKLVEADGIEPTTSCLQSTRSPN
jgi:hypothetical protein